MRGKVRSVPVVTAAAGPDPIPRIRAARGYAGFSQAQVAEVLGVSTETVKRIEKGERPVRPMELREIAAACDLPYEFFVMDFWDAAAALEFRRGIEQRVQQAGNRSDDLVAEQQRLMRLDDEARLFEARLMTELERRFEAQGEELDRRMQEIFNRLSTTTTNADREKTLEALFKDTNLDDETAAKIRARLTQSGEGLAEVLEQEADRLDVKRRQTAEESERKRRKASGE